MKRILFLSLFALAAIAVRAVPASGCFFDYRQPDGTLLRVRLIGDEHAHAYQTADGRCFLPDEEGWLRPCPHPHLARRAIPGKGRGSVAPVGNGLFQTRKDGAATKEEGKVLIVMVEYSDVKFTDTRERISTSQIQLSSTISAEKPIAEVPAHTTTYTDTLKHFGDYYYALIARDKNGTLFNMLFPTVNATVKAVSLIPPDDFYEFPQENDEQYVPGFLRELPLPYLDLISDLNIPPTRMSAKAKKQGTELAGKYAVKKPTLLHPYIFEQDMVLSPEGDDFYLFESLKNYFIKKDYKGSVTDLRKLLSVKRSPEVTTRAVFYLAESQYYCKNYRHALELFLFLEDDVPELAKKWIDSTLDFYQIPTN